MSINDQATIWIKKPLAVCAKDSADGVVIRGQRIVELVGSGKTPESAIDEIYDARDSVVLPGLINTHHHFYQTLTRAYQLQKYQLM